MTSRAGDRLDLRLTAVHARQPAGTLTLNQGLETFAHKGGFFGDPTCNAPGLQPAVGRQYSARYA